MTCQDGSRRSKLVASLNVAVRILGVVLCLYLFLVGIELMGPSIRVLGGKGAASLFRNIPNSVAALMIGILATLMVQSSSTSTSVVVALVAAGQMEVRPSIPIIMGANIGTSVTNTLVSMGQSGSRIQLERAFAGATIQDFFNLMSVAVLFPVEELFHPIEAIASSLARAVVGEEKCEGCAFESPIDVLVKPATKLIVDSNKNVIYAMSLGAPVPEPGSIVVTSNCSASAGAEGRQQQQQAACGEQRFWCLGETMGEVWGKINNKKSQRWSCQGKGIENAGTLCDSCTAPGCGNICTLDADIFFNEEVEHGDTIKGGLMNLFESSEVGGSLALVASLLIMMLGLIGFVKLMHSLLLTKAKQVLRKSTRVPGVVSIAIGTLVTIAVQSSSVTTSALTPLVGLGVLDLGNMFPLTLGANIGTCSTTVLAAFATMDLHGMTIAFCHLTFNLLGICLFYPIPLLRRIPLYEANLAGMYASVYRWFPLAYIAFVFVVVPLTALAISFLFQASFAAGLIVLIVILVALVGLAFWWNFRGGCYKLLSREQRLETIFGRVLEGLEELPPNGKDDDSGSTKGEDQSGDSDATTTHEEESVTSRREGTGVQTDPELGLCQRM